MKREPRDDTSFRCAAGSDPGGDAEVVAVGVGEAEVAQAPRPVPGRLCERVAGGADDRERGVEILDLEHDLDAGAAPAGEALLREARAWPCRGELRDRFKPDDGIAPAEARVVVHAA